MIVARGLYLGISPNGDKALWLASAQEQYEFPKEMAPYLEFASGSLLRDETEALMATLDHGDDAIRVLSEAKVILELPADVDGALKALAGMQIHPLNVRLGAERAVADDGDPIHDITVRRVAGQDELVIPHPISTVMEDLENDLPDAVRAVAAASNVEVTTVLAQVLAQLGYLIAERIGFLADTVHER